MGNKNLSILLYAALIVSSIIYKITNFTYFISVVLLSPILFIDLKSAFSYSRKCDLSIIFVLPLLFILEPLQTLNSLFIAFSEELFFRVYLLSYFSNLLTSILFTIPHTIIYQDLHSFVTFFPSLFYGFVYQKTKSFSLVVVLHFISNEFYVVFLSEIFK
jgi:membrane protease YdiL (CAAX protease family)